MTAPTNLGNNKIFTVEATTGWTVYMVVEWLQPGFFLDSNTGGFSPDSTNAPEALSEDAVLLGFYSVQESRTQWPSGNYVVSYYHQAGVDPDPFTDDVIRTDLFSIELDIIINQLNGIPVGLSDHDMLVGNSSGGLDALPVGSGTNFLGITAGAPTWRSLVAADLPTVTVAKGGTAITTYTLGDLLYSSASNTLAKLAGNTTTTKKFLSQTGTGTISAAPSWATVSKSDVGLGNVENTALSTWAGSTNIVTLGTLESLILTVGSDPVSPVDGQIWRTAAGLRGKVGSDVGTFTFTPD